MNLCGQKTDVRTLFQFNKIFWGLLLTSALGCQTVPPPVEEYVLAKSALDSALRAGAPKWSHGHWQQAEVSFKRAEGLYTERSYAEARSEFIKSRKSAEKAENSTRFQKYKSGDFQ